MTKHLTATLRASLMLACIAAPLAACASASEPMVNRMGVDDARYSRDLADCKQRSGPSLGFSNPVATCLTGKGYQVLMGK